MKSNGRKNHKALHGLHALATVQKQLQAQAAQAAEQARQAAQAKLAAERAKRVFADAVGPVTPMPNPGLAATGLPKPEPLPRQREADERAALLEAWSDVVDIDTLLLTDDGLAYRREGVSADVVNRLRRGQWAIQGQLDLHGLRRDEAREALGEFLQHAAAQGWRCLRVVHGKGLGSPGREPVLKAKVQRWLAQRAQVLAFTQASGPQGGAGALVVLLAGSVGASTATAEAAPARH